MRPSLPSPGLLLLSLVLALPTVRAITFQDFTGFTQLPSGLNGAGVVFGLVEADTNGSTTITDYRAVAAGPTITYQDAADPAQTYGVSSHANTVLSRYLAAAPGTTQVINTETLSFFNRHLGITATNYPAAAVSEPASDVINFSFIFNTTDNATLTAVENRTDYLVSKWNKVVVAGVSGNASPASSYNVIAVAELNNAYTAPRVLGRGVTAGPTPGRVLPDLLAPGSATDTSGGPVPSFAAPVVSAAAAVLVQAARATPALAAADDARVVKSLLLTGATKLAGWHTDATTQPLDRDQGAGVLDIANSHAILLAGQAPASASLAYDASGWDLGTVTRTVGPGGDATAWYYFDVPAGAADSGFTVTATLAWNRQIADNLSTVTLRNLDLTLFSVSAGTFNTVQALSASNGTLDNVEHIFTSFGAGMTGRYALRVDGVGFNLNQSETYALSWDAAAIPEPAHASLLAALTVGGLALVRRRRRA
jgi:predicted nucleic acid-binding protein